MLDLYSDWRKNMEKAILFLFFTRIKQISEGSVLLCKRWWNTWKAGELLAGFKVTLTRPKQYWEDKEKNQAFEELLENVGNRHYCSSGRCFIQGLPWMLRNGRRNERVWSTPRGCVKYPTKKSVLYTSFIAKEGTKFYNRGGFMFPDGNQICYDKRQLFSLGKRRPCIFTAGTERRSFITKDGRSYWQICFDLRFPEIQRK